MTTKTRKKRVKIDDKWLKTHKWMLRSSNNGVSYNGFRWKHRVWTIAPDWRDDNTCGGGLHGETPEHHGFGMTMSRPDLCEVAGAINQIEGNKVKVRKARIVASAGDIPAAAYIACGYIVVTDDGCYTVTDGDRLIVLAGSPTITQSGGDLRTCDTSKPVITQSGGDLRTCDTSKPVITQSGGDLWTFNNSKPVITKAK